MNEDKLTPYELNLVEQIWLNELPPMCEFDSPILRYRVLRVRTLSKEHKRQFIDLIFRKKIIKGIEVAWVFDEYEIIELNGI